MHASRIARFVCAALLGLGLAGLARATGVTIARPDYQNLSSEGANVQGKNTALTIIGGHVSPVATAPASTGLRLTESSFGQPLAQWLVDDGTFTEEVVSYVRGQLYPSAEATRAQVLTSGTAFRYKTLLFSPAPGEVDVTNHFDSIQDWFGDNERATARAMIPLVRGALALNPFDTDLRNLLLDIYYDLAVAEMQFTTKKLAELATMRLGFVQTGPFIIDQEIAAYASTAPADLGLIPRMEGILDLYRELLSSPDDGIEPSDFDPDPLVRGMPMGHYVFIRSQHNRNSTPSQYVDADGGGLSTVPTVATPENPLGVRPNNEVLFAGYKDYTTLLTILGRYVQYQADLARLRGMRQGTNDITLARQATDRMQNEIARDFRSLLGLVPAATFLPSNASGVAAVVSGVETALTDIVNVRAFLTGRSNLLGLSPDFLLLVQDNAPTLDGPRESFDVLAGNLKDRPGFTNRPLTVALNLMATAEDRYTNFRASVDRVVTELENLEADYEIRYFDITGYNPTDTPGFKGFAKRGIASELQAVESTIETLQARIRVLGDLGGRLQQDLDTAAGTVTEAEGLRTNFLDARQVYINKTNSIYLGQKITAGIAAGTQALTDGGLAILSLDPANAILSAGGTALAIGAASVANGVTQVANAVNEIETAQGLDQAALEFQTTTEATDAALTVNQAKQEYGAIKRETYTHQLERADTESELAQAIAQKAALLLEVRRIEQRLVSYQESVRSKYYADPIHYLKAESALVEADEAFRNAQRWLFYTQRALEYKWQQSFAITQGSKSWDSNSIFKLRNARELDALLTQLVAWDAPRAAEVINQPVNTTFISLRDNIIAPNPNRLNLTDRTDPGVRQDLRTGDVVTTHEFFRRRLAEWRDSAGFISIPFNTAILDNLGNFFRGPDYLPNGTIIPGTWRNKIVSVKVNLIATDGGSVPTQRLGSLIYAGTTLQRTRRPLRADRSQPPLNATGNPLFRDIPGEFTNAPFRYWESVDFNNLFFTRTEQPTTLVLAYSGASARNNTTGEDVLGDTFKNVAFAQRSVAATGWVLVINPAQVNLNTLRDIEIIIRHRYSDRAQPN